MKKYIFLIFLCSSISSIAQQKKIKILNANFSEKREAEHPGAIYMLGNVIVEHEGAILKCKKAYLYEKSNLFKAYGDVIINQGDTIVQTSKYADYNGNTKQALSWGNVVLKDPKMVLTTDTLQFNRAEQVLYYNDGGTIKDETNVLTSKNGTYYLANKKFTATTKVNVTNPDNKLVSNHLDYYTTSGQAYLYGPSTITTKESTIYTEKGFHDTKANISHLVKNASIQYDDRLIEGDSLFYNKTKNFASSTGNIKVTDTINNLVTKGGYAEYFKDKDSIFIVDKAVSITVFEKDSMYIHGDTLLVTGKPEKRVLRAFHHVKIFKSDLRGKCDSLHTDQSTGITKMFRDPILWAEENQITGDSIHLLTNLETDQLDSLKILNNAFMVQKDSAGFSQIKGRDMFGKFRKNKLRTLLVKGNAEVINYGRNEENELIGITKKESSNIEFTLRENEIETIKFLKSPDGKTYPPSKFPKQENKLKGFIWREDEKPLTKEDIFKHGKNTNAKAKKNLKLPTQQ